MRKYKLYQFLFKLCLFWIKVFLVSYKQVIYIFRYTYLITIYLFIGKGFVYKEIFLFVLIHILMVVFCISFIRAICTNPGLVPKAWKDLIQAEIDEYLK